MSLSGIRTDGDTSDVLTHLGFRIGWEQRLRLYGVDTYEHTFKDRGDEYGH